MNAKERVLILSILQNMRSQLDSLMVVISQDDQAARVHRTEAPSDSPYLTDEEEDRLGKALGLQAITKEQLLEDEAVVKAQFLELTKRREANMQDFVSEEMNEPFEYPKDEPVTTPNLDKYIGVPQSGSVTLSDELLGLGT
jgi:hypothetical protein